MGFRQCRSLGEDAKGEVGDKTHGVATAGGLGLTAAFSGEFGGVD